MSSHRLLSGFNQIYHSAFSVYPYQPHIERRFKNDKDNVLTVGIHHYSRKTFLHRANTGLI